MKPERWQHIWRIVAIILLPVVLLVALRDRPTEEQIMSVWASHLRRTVERFPTAGADALRRLDPSWQDERPEEPETYAGMSDREIVVQIHGRYRPYLTTMPSDVLERNARRLGHSSFAQVASTTIPLSQSQAKKVGESIARIDAEHERALTELPMRQLEAVARAVALAWVIPMGLWYALGLSAQWWRLFFVRRRRVIGASVLVIGAGLLVTGIMESDSFGGGFGAMMLVGGFLLYRQEGGG